MVAASAGTRIVAASVTAGKESPTTRVKAIEEVFIKRGRLRLACHTAA
jgi:hypothetical protein